MQYYCQRDQQWAADKLGASTLTIAGWGCTTSSVAMIATYFGEAITPPMLAHNVHNYTKDGLILWKNLSFKKMKFDYRYYTDDRKVIDAALKDPNKAVILQVNNGAHWVVAMRKTLLGNDYVILDPWTGKKSTAIGQYHNITGCAVFSRK